MKHPEGELLGFEQSLRRTKSKSREVSSRFLPQKPLGNVVNSPTNVLSPIRQGAARSSSFNGKPKGPADSGLMRGLWPPSSSSTNGSSDAKHGTLAECFRNERKMDLAQRTNVEKPDKSVNPVSLNRQRSCKEQSEFENDRKIAKENRISLFGASVRYTGKFKFPGSGRSSKSPNLSDDNIVPGRLSVDETALRRRSLGRKSDYSADFLAESGSEQSDIQSGTSFSSPLTTGKNFQASYMAPTVSSRMAGIEVSSKYLQDSLLRSRRTSSDSAAVQAPTSPKKFAFKSAVNKSNSIKISACETTKLGDSPGRSLPSIFSEETGGKGMSKPPTSPSKVKGVGNLLSIGFELLKGKKSHPSASSPLGSAVSATFHQLRLFHNRLLQWRYANARAEAIDGNISEEAKRNLVRGWDGLANLRNSVRLKKVQLEKEKLEMKLNYIIRSQIKSLEAWGAMERQHQSAITVTKDSLHSVVCKVPLVEGAKAEPESISLALRTVSDITGTIKWMNSEHSSMAHETAATSRELTEIVIQEKLLLEECLEHFKIISALEVEEASLKCNLMQLKLQSGQQHLHQGISS